MKISVTAKWQIGDRHWEKTAEAEVIDILGPEDEVDLQITRTVDALFAGIKGEVPEA